MSATAEALVRAAEAAGLRLSPRDGGVLHVEPRERLTPDLREALKAHKGDVLALLRARDLGVDWARVSLWQLDKVLEISVPWADVPLLIAPGCRIARALRAKDPRPGRVWCVCEILDVLLTNVPPEDARKIAQAKLSLDGEVVGVRSGGPS